MNSRVVVRGDVYWVEFAVGIGGEISKTRPAVIVSNDVANRVMNRVQVVPLTSRATRVYPGEALVAVGGSPHKALANQITTISKERLREFIGRLSQPDLRTVESAIRRQLGLTR